MSCLSASNRMRALLLVWNPVVITALVSTMIEVANGYTVASERFDPQNFDPSSSSHADYIIQLVMNGTFMWAAWLPLPHS